MDPLGFALENYDAIGRWRTEDGQFAIDAKGLLPDGQAFEGAAELKKILKANPREFVWGMTGKMLTYALGRGLESEDEPVVRSIGWAMEKRGNRFSALVEGIVESAPFRMRKAEEVRRAAR
jgi:hypothetical protein